MKKINNLASLQQEKYRLQVAVRDQGKRVQESYGAVTEKLDPFWSVLSWTSAFNKGEGFSGFSYKSLIGPGLILLLPKLLEMAANSNSWWSKWISGILSVVQGENIQDVVSNFFNSNKEEESPNEDLND